MKRQRRQLRASPAPAPYTCEQACAVLQTAERLGRQHRYGGMVPLPDLRAALAEAAPGLRRAAVDAALLDLARDYALDLQVHHDPASLTPAEERAGIWREGRGLLYFVVLRD